MDNNAPILRRYVARAVPSPDGPYFYARFGFPGGREDWVLDGDEAARYATVADAEVAAHRVLVESLNARTRFGDKREISIKMSSDEFAAELAESNIGLSDFATIWGTKQANVHDWITGAKDVPFALRWVLRLLRLPGAVAMARKIVEENTTVKPEWVGRHPMDAENEEGR